MKRLFALVTVFILCWGCTKDQAPQGGGGAADTAFDSSMPLPVVSTAEIVTPNATSEHPLSLQFTTASGEMRPTLFVYKWYVDGTLVEGANLTVLEPQNFRKGATVQAEVIPTDGKRTGAAFRTKPVVILNAPPVVTAASIQPVPAFAGTTLSVSAEASDRDNDRVTFEVQWLVNGANVPGSEQGQLSTAGLKKKDRITAMVTPYDGQGRGAPFPTGYLILSNANPDITSVPPSGIQNGAFVYQVVAKDPDGDPISFGLVSAPPGMTIDKGTGLVKWDIPAVTERQQIVVKISAEDGDGGVVYQEFSIGLEKR